LWLDVHFIDPALGPSDPVRRNQSSFVRYQIIYAGVLMHAKFFPVQLEVSLEA
jgi:hypothetical protein